MRRQLTLAAAAIASMIVIAFLVPLALLVRTIAADRALSAAQQVANGLGPVIITSESGSQLGQVVAGLNTGDPSHVTVLLADGTELGAPVDDSLIGDNVKLARQGKSFSVEERGGSAIYVPIVQPGRTHVVRSFVPEAVLRRGVAASWLVLGGLGLALVAVATLVADRLARSIVRPVNELASTAESLSRGELDRRVAPSGPPEIVEVGQTLNLLAGRIDDLLADERESVADLSHRLRTPVTALRLDAEAIADSGDRQRLVDDVDSLEQAVSHLILTARRGVDASASRSCDLVAVTKERVRFWGPLVEDQGRSLELDLPEDSEPIVVGIPADELMAALDALVGNVLAHTPEGSNFRIRLVAPGTRAAGDGERADDPHVDGERGDREHESDRGTTARAVLIVDDAGPGFRDSDDLARGRSGGGSTGLGLDIVRRTAVDAGGHLDIGPSPLGGARVRVHFGDHDGA